MKKYMGHLYAETHGRARLSRRQGGSSQPATEQQPETQSEASKSSARRRRWAKLVRRIYETDPLVSVSCGGPMVIIVFITERAVILKILSHLDEVQHSGRAPP